MKYSLIFIYVAVNMFLFFFNWNLFTTWIDVNLIFGTYTTLPFLVLQILGGIILAAYTLWDRMKDLQREVIITNLQKKIVELQKDAEIEILKKLPNTSDKSLESSKKDSPSLLVKS